MTGRVQGVGFRWYVAEAATREGVSGFVRNLRDGGVEVEVEGDAEAVTRVELAVRRGPPGARVESVTVEPCPPTARATGFAIRG